MYTLTDEALMDSMEGDEMALKAFEYMADYTDSYAAMMTSMRSPDFQWQLTDMVLDLLIRSCGATPEPTTVEIDGQQLPAQRVHLDVTTDAMLDMLEGVASCGIPEVENMVASCTAHCWARTAKAWMNSSPSCARRLKRTMH